jgi:hypothetical protein
MSGAVPNTYNSFANISFWEPEKRRQYNDRLRAGWPRFRSYIYIYIFIYYLLQMGFSPVAVVKQVTHITRSNNIFNQTQYTKHNIKGHPTTMNTKTTVSTETIQQLQQIQQKN